MKKKTLSLALALALCLGLTVPAFADEDEYIPNYDISTKPIGTVTMQEESPIDGELITFDMPVYPVNTVITPKEDWEWDTMIEEDFGVTGREPLMLTQEGTYYFQICSTKEVATGIFTVVIGKAPDVQQPGDQPTTPPADTIPASGTAVASNQTVTVDGKAVEFQMYALVDANGNGTNYIKLRDMAQVLKGTKAQFSVGYDNASKSISVTSGEEYASTGTEMTTPFSGDRSYTGGTQSIQVNGKAVDMTAITLVDDAGGGYNYFKLRDLGKALGFNVGYSNEQGVYIESDKPYAE